MPVFVQSGIQGLFLISRLPVYSSNPWKSHIETTGLETSIARFFCFWVTVLVHTPTSALDIFCKIPSIDILVYAAFWNSMPSLCLTPAELKGDLNKGMHSECVSDRSALLYGDMRDGLTMRICIGRHDCTQVAALDI